MSAVDIAVRVFRELESDDLKILQAIEQQQKNYYTGFKWQSNIVHKKVLK